MINKQTSLDLNGPILSFVRQPSSVSIVDNSSTTFVGIATATFPTQDPTNPASNTGSISYRWYDQNGPLSDGTNITGTATTTLSLSNLRNSTDNGRRFYLTADYIPSAYGLTGVAVTVGSARSTGNAVNDVLNSNTVTLTVFSNISIVSQPSSSTVSQDTNTTFSVSARLSDGTESELSYKWSLNGVDLNDGAPIPGAVVSGSSTPNLTISYPVVGTYSIRARVSHPTAGNSPFFSSTVSFGVTPKDLILNIETVGGTSNTAILQSHNLAVNGDLTFLAQNYTDPSTFISLYAPDRDVEIEMDLYGGKGNDFSSYVGGQGGFSRIRFTMKQNEEYVIAGLNATDNCAFIYRKNSLIAVVGNGGNASNTGNGGSGGGIGVSGASGGGSGGGTGGQVVPSGQLTTTGIFGSAATAPLSSIISPDTKASGQNGGRALSCTKGRYWISQGFSPCQDMGNVQLYLANGTLVSNTARIQRGHKAGYGIRDTNGAGAVASSFQRLVSRTCTRTIPKTCYRDVTSTLTKTATISDVQGSISISGDFFPIGRYGTFGQSAQGNPLEAIGYDGRADGLGFSDYNYSISVTVLDRFTRASGEIDPTGSISFHSSFKPNPFFDGAAFRVSFSMNSPIPGFGLQSTLVRSWRISLTGNQIIQQPFDCSTTEFYDCSYYETIQLSGGGNGGRGATGGRGGNAGAGGGGGSGYTDGSVTVLSSQQGGSTGNARVIIKSTVSSAPVVTPVTPPAPTPSVPVLASIFYTSTILSVKPGSGTVGSFSGFTGGSGSGANGFRYNAPTGNYFMELQITNNNWNNSHGFVGVSDDTHWNDLNWTSAQGARLMYYIGNNFSYGEQTGSSQTGTNFNQLLVSGDILGIVVNRESGRVAFYKNGVYLVTISNSRAVGRTLYVTVSDWFFKLSLTCNALSSYSQYAVNYVLP